MNNKDSLTFLVIIVKPLSFVMFILYNSIREKYIKIVKESVMYKAYPVFNKTHPDEW